MPTAKPWTALLSDQDFHRDVEVEGQHPQPGHGLQAEAERHADARIDPAHEARDHEADQHADAAASDHLPDQRIGKAGLLLQQRRQQHHRREVQHAVDRHQRQPDRIVAVGQQLQVQERLARR